MAVVFTRAAKTITLAELPPAGLFDELYAQSGLKNQIFTAVGYGVLEVERGPGGPNFPYHGIRCFAYSSFDAFNPTWLRLSQINTRGNSGTC